MKSSADSQTFDLVVTNGHCVLSHEQPNAQVEIGIRDGRIAAIGEKLQSKAQAIFDAKGLHVLPGAIDSQVHFREPGLTHKEDFETGTRAAVLGGITSVLEMPNTQPPTTSFAAFNDKMARIQGRCWSDYALYAGATPENVDILGELELKPGCSGIKVFMGSSTGTLLVPDDEHLLAILLRGRRRVSFHAEDEMRLRERKSLLGESPSVLEHPHWRDVETALRASRRLINLARRSGRAIHILHITTAEEIELFRANRDLNLTCEVTPQHLILSAPECYERLGTYAQMNPPIREARHREALWAGIADGTVTMLGSDHAPHTRDEKEKPYPQSPSGMTGVQTMLPLMLDQVNRGRLSLARLCELLSFGPSRAFGLKRKGQIAVGMDADLSIVDLNAKREITNRWIASRCQWTPFDGTMVKGWPIATLIRGQIVMRDDQVLGNPVGRPLEFS